MFSFFSMMLLGLRRSLKLGDQRRPNRCYPFILDWPILLYIGLALSNLSEMQSPVFYFCSKVCY